MSKITLVSNTGPLIALSKIECLITASEHYRILVPAIVSREWHSSPKVWPNSITILPETVPDPLLRLQLDIGEASVIESALQQNYSQVLIDEQKARKVARNVYGLSVIGTARIMVELNRAGLIGSLYPLFSKLRKESYWIDETIVNWALRSIEEITTQSVSN